MNNFLGNGNKSEDTIKMAVSEGTGLSQTDTDSHRLLQIAASFKNPNVFLKVIALVLIYICLVLVLMLAPSKILYDPEYYWIIIPWIFIWISITLPPTLLGHRMPLQVELAILIFGMITFIASGGVVIDLYAKAASSDSDDSRQKTLALGSMCIITGFVFFVDVVFTAFNVAK